MREKKRHKEAFQMFYELGGEPTQENCRRVTEGMQIAERTFWNWYKHLNWRQRIQEADQKAHELAMKKLIKQAAQRKKEHIEVLQELQEEFRIEMDYLRAPFAFAREDIHAGNVRINNTKDMAELARGRQGYAKSIMDAQKQEMAEMGEPTDRVEHSGKVELTGIEALWDKYLRKNDGTTES